MFDIPRYLLYQERYSLDDFNVNDEKGISYNNCLCKELLKRESPTNANDRAKEILSIFNTAYYLCTIFLIDSSPEIRVKGYYYAAKYRNNYSPLVGNHIIALFYFYLYHMESYENLSIKIKTMIDMMDATMDSDVRNMIKNFEYSSKGLNKLVLPENFALREANDELLKSVNWKSVTQNFRLSKIYTIAMNVCMDALNMCNILKYICQQMIEDKDLSKGIKDDKKYVIILLQDNILDKEDGAEVDEKEILALIEKEETLYYNDIIEEIETVPLSAYEEIEKQYLELKEENDVLKEKLKDDNQYTLEHVEEEKELKKPNYEGIKVHMSRNVFPKCISELYDGYDETWLNNYMTALMNSKFRDEIAEKWVIKNKRKTMVGEILGVLILAKVIKGNYNAIASLIDENKSRTLAKYMGGQEDNPITDWTKEYIEEQSKP